MKRNKERGTEDQSRVFLVLPFPPSGGGQQFCIFSPVLGSDQKMSGRTVVAALDACDGVGNGAIQVRDVATVKFFRAFYKHDITS